MPPQRLDDLIRQYGVQPTQPTQAPAEPPRDTQDSVMNPEFDFERAELERKRGWLADLEPYLAAAEYPLAALSLLGWRTGTLPGAMTSAVTGAGLAGLQVPRVIERLTAGDKWGAAKAAGWGAAGLLGVRGGGRRAFGAKAAAERAKTAERWKAFKTGNAPEGAVELGEQSLKADKGRPLLMGDEVAGPAPAAAAKEVSNGTRRIEAAVAAGADPEDAIVQEVLKQTSKIPAGDTTIFRMARQMKEWARLDPANNKIPEGLSDALMRAMVRAETMAQKEHALRLAVVAKQMEKITGQISKIDEAESAAQAAVKLASQPDEVLQSVSALEALIAKLAALHPELADELVKAKQAAGVVAKPAGEVAETAKKVGGKNAGRAKNAERAAQKKAEKLAKAVQEGKVDPAGIVSEGVDVNAIAESLVTGKNKIIGIAELGADPAQGVVMYGASTTPGKIGEKFVRTAPQTVEDFKKLGIDVPPDVAKRLAAMTPSPGQVTAPRAAPMNTGLPQGPTPIPENVPVQHLEPGTAYGAEITGTVRPRPGIVSRSQAPTITKGGAIEEMERLSQSARVRNALGMGSPAHPTEPPRLVKGPGKGAMVEAGTGKRIEPVKPSTPAGAPKPSGFNTMRDQLDEALGVADDAPMGDVPDPDLFTEMEAMDEIAEAVGMGPKAISGATAREMEIVGEFLSPRHRAAMLQASGMKIPLSLRKEMAAGRTNLDKLSPETRKITDAIDTALGQLAKGGTPNNKVISQALATAGRVYRGEEPIEALARAVGADVKVAAASPAAKKVLDPEAAKDAREAGFIAADLLVRTGLALGGGAAGWEAVRQADPNSGYLKRGIGALGGAWAGGAAAHIGSGAVQGARSGIGALTGGARAAREAQFFSMLSRPDTIARAWAGSVGAVAVKAVERQLTGRPDLARKGLEVLRDEWTKILRNPIASYKHAGSLAAQGRIHSRVRVGSTANYPAHLIAMADKASTKAMRAMGYSIDEAARMNLSGSPQTQKGRQIVNMLGGDVTTLRKLKNGQIRRRVMKSNMSEGMKLAANIFIPFPRVTVTMAENALKYSPLALTKWARKAFAETPGGMVSWNMAKQRAKMGTAVGLGGYAMAANTPNFGLDDQISAGMGPLTGISQAAMEKARQEQSDQSAWSNIQRFASAIPMVDEKLSISNVAGRAIPSVIGQAAKAMDPAFARGAGVGDAAEMLEAKWAEDPNFKPGFGTEVQAGLGGIAGGIMSKMPGLREMLPEKAAPVDIFGKPTTASMLDYIPDGTLRGFKSIMIPVEKALRPTSTYQPSIYPKKDPLAQEIRRVVEATPDYPQLSPPSQGAMSPLVRDAAFLGKLPEGMQATPLPTGLRSDMQRLRGAVTELPVQRLINDPRYKSAGPEMQRYLLGKVINKARGQVSSGLSALQQQGNLTQDPAKIEEFRALAQSLIERTARR